MTKFWLFPLPINGLNSEPGPALEHDGKIARMFGASAGQFRHVAGLVNVDHLPRPSPATLPVIPWEGPVSNRSLSRPATLPVCYLADSNGIAAICRRASKQRSWPALRIGALPKVTQDPRKGATLHL
ncbi:hypothetical protein [Tahibacter harae]|uniref:RES domain-containing protein n=1 Tax=Tahibacter harae TaxID=2963937 RepID=A0ABT1QQY9_9GAMM|nr:hypothetical protein [Tahibacter harae]MCQ4164707.1 hypothetical protein [Tahibacter harae]